MATKIVVNGQENGVIAFKGDHEPCAVYIDGVRQDNVSYAPELIEGENTVSYSSEYKKNIRTMQIEGNTEQYQGTFAPQNIDIPTSYVTPSNAPIIVSTTPITVPNDARLTLTANKTGSGNISSLSSGFVVIISDSQDDIANNYTEILEDYGTPQYLATPKVSGEFYIGIANFLVGGIDNPQAYWDFLRANYTFTLSTEGNTVPNPDYPQPIHNANDNGMSLELRGYNLLNKENFTSKALREETVATLHATQVMSNAQVNAMLKPNTTYTISFEVEGVEGRPSGATQNSAQGFLLHTKVSNASWIYMTTNRIAKPGEIIKMNITFTTPANFYDCGFQMWAYSGNYRLSGSSTGINAKCIFRKVQIVEGSTAKPYEPYFEPVTVDIPSSVTVGSSTIPLRFARIQYKDNVWADYLEVNRLEGTVNYVSNVAYFKYPHADSVYNYNNFYYGVQTVDGFSENHNKNRGVCTHTGVVGDAGDLANMTKNAIWCGVSNGRIYWIGILDTLGFRSLPTKEEQVQAFNDWLDEQEAKGTPVEVFYRRNKPVPKDITITDLGQELLALINSTQNATNIITITSTPSVSKLSVNYAKWGGAK